MDTQNTEGEEEQLEVECEELPSCSKDIVQIQKEVKVVGHKSYTADLYGVELLMQK